MSFELKTVCAAFQNQVEKRPLDVCTVMIRENNLEEYTWNEMNHKVRQTASFLMEKGIQPGDRVALFAENRYEWWVIDQAVLSLGAIDVPIYATNSANEAGYIINDSKASICFVGSLEHLERIESVRHSLPSLKEVVVLDNVESNTVHMSEIFSRDIDAQFNQAFEKSISHLDPESLATLIYTSGTTGAPKGVMLTHNNFLKNVEQALATIGYSVTEGDSFLSFLPLSHAFERTVGYYLPLYAGSRVHFSRGFNHILDDLKMIQPTILISVPRLFEKMHAGVLSQVQDASFIKKQLFYAAMRTAKNNLKYHCTWTKRTGFFASWYSLLDSLVFSKLKSALGLERLRFAISGGGPLAVTDGEFFIGMGIMLHEGFGLTETSPVTNVNPKGLIKPGKVGIALMDTEVSIADDGEVLIRGPQVMRGYYNRPEETQEVLTSDGWFKTGDIGVIDTDGYLTITGRIKDIIVTAGGKNISPQNIENALKGSLFIEQAAVIGDRRKFLSALVVPSIEEIEKWAERNNILFSSVEELLAFNEVLDLFNNEINDKMKSFARVEQIRKFTLLRAEWSQETGELTPKQSVKRRVLEEKYRDIIESMYQE